MSLVEKVLAVSYIKGKRCYFLKWKNYNSLINSWEPENNRNFNALIKKFNKIENLKALSQQQQKSTIAHNY